MQLISPAVEDNAPIPSLSIATVAALTPPDVQISFSDDLINPIDLDGKLKAADLVEIGRASCREKSVDLGGRRIIKKKKKLMRMRM